MSKEMKKCCCRSVIHSSVLLLVCGTILFAAGSKCRAQSASSALAANWLDKATRDVSPPEAALLKRSRATLMRNVITGDAWKPYRGVMPSLGSYRGIWNWDSAFHAVGISHWDPELAREQFKILFGKQLPSGALPDVIWERRGMVTTFTKPPVMAWAVAVVDRRSPDIRFLQEIYPKLIKLGDFWLNERGGAADGLFYYAGTDTGDDSGWDDSIRWDHGYRYSKSNNHRLWAIDLNCYMVSHYRAMAYIAQRLELSQDRDKWTRMASELATRINAKLWDDKLGFYVDRDRKTGKDGPALSPAGFMPLFVHIASPQQAARLATIASDPVKFFPGMPTVAYDTPGYVRSGYWRGPAWVNTSYFALQGLREYGYSELTEKMRSNLLDWISADRSSLREYYDSRTGKGGGAEGFGWSASFTIAFILDWNNDNLTWLFH
jgi:putative isomerase